jgi:hypothetical protein
MMKETWMITCEGILKVNTTMKEAWIMSQPYFERVWGWDSHSQNGDLGLPKLQNSITGVKTPHLEVFFTTLENYQSVDVENGITWAIWTSEAQVMDKKKAGSVATLLWEKGEDETHTPEMGTWESFGTPKNSEFDFKGQNTLHWGVLYIIRKLSKCRCPKWVRMTHLDICNTSYGQKKC